jgi:hypothetical protein
MKACIFLYLLLVFVPALAQEIVVDWACPRSSPKMPIKISYVSNNFILSPDISLIGFPQNERCYEDFRQDFVSKLRRIHQNSCSQSTTGLCSLQVSDAEILLKKTFSSNQALSLGKAASLPPTSVPESVLRQKVNSGEINLRNLNQTFQINRRDYRVSDFDKVIGNNIEKIFQGISRQEARQFTQNYMLAKSNILRSGPPSAERISVQQNLEKMFGYIYGEKGDEELTTALQCLPEGETLRPLLAIAKQVSTNNNRCKLPTPGQSMVFLKDTTGNVFTGNYTLRRKSDGNYQALINFNFKSRSGRVTPEQMMQRTKMCMAQVSPAMKGPDGSRIELIPLTQAEMDRFPVQERHPSNDVTIENRNFPTNAEAYAEDVDCSIITHEVLHLFGLCDEYLESGTQSCRVETKAPSIMRDHVDAYTKAVGGTFKCSCSSGYCKSIMNSPNESIRNLFLLENIYNFTNSDFRERFCSEEFLDSTSGINLSSSTVLLEESEEKVILESRFLSPKEIPPFFKPQRSKITCSCQTNDLACRKKLKEISQFTKTPRVMRTCPWGTEHSGLEPGQQISNHDFNGTHLKFFAPPLLPTLLHPNQFYKMLEGSCRGRSSGYQECADFAYKSPKPSCDVPERCHDDSYFLGSRQ